MIAICDSGASKGDWAFISTDGEVQYLEVSGFNPYTHDHGSYYTELIKKTPHHINQQVNQVTYYGTGCGEQSKKNEVKGLLSRVFTHASIQVETDLLAAARATCGTSKGIAVITGTGSNSGLYDGQLFIDSVPNLGYLLGDEGSGNYFGNLITRAYFFRDMPSDLIVPFETFVGGRHELLLQKLYDKTRAVNTYLASFMPFASLHIEHPFIQKLMKKNFQDLVDANLSKYQDYHTTPIHFVGSVAYHFKTFLQACLEENRLICGNILARPMDNLVNYHQQPWS